MDWLELMKLEYEPVNQFFPPRLIEKLIISEDQIDRTKPIHTFSCLDLFDEKRYELKYIDDNGKIIIVSTSLDKENNCDTFLD
jgi:hypothetical protein